jgi:hypothetical protein
MGKREVYSFVANKRAGSISCNKRETLARTHFTPVSSNQKLPDTFFFSEKTGNTKNRQKDEVYFSNLWICSKERLGDFAII